ncbi:MAG: class I SAM-dependent methyltransferase, partial [Candidatus Eremiobacteraeota bacterium]|nr:class I SAM-dependent methyltransferase [Candidatus Eremiobacteraeota bacterium]
MYSLVDFGSMLTDNVRVQAYHKALEEVAGGKRVLEIGGGTGFFACLASAAGAEHVTSIETNSLITQGPALARSNGLTNIKFAMGSAQHYQADEPFDVIIHDLRGNTPFFEGSMATIRDARRLLKPGGRFLPQRDRVFAALVDDEVAFRRMEGVWGQRLAGLDLTALRAATHRRLRYEPSENATHWEPQLIADVSYIDPKEDAVDSTVTFAPDHDGVCHGVALWFETELTDNVGYTTNPWAPSQNRGTTYGVCFLPWARPIEIKEGESYRLEVGLSSKGQARCKISQNLGGSDLLLGMFEETYSAYKDIQIFTNSRFIANPLLKAYRVAMQGVEKGNSSAAIAKKLQQSCDNIPSEEAAYKLLAKVAQFTQVRVARGREKTTHL